MAEPALNTATQAPARAEKEALADVQHLDQDGRPVIFASEAGNTRIWNPLLILSCIAFGSTAVLFGYDDKVISPVAAMPTFVSVEPALSNDLSVAPTYPSRPLP